MTAGLHCLHERKPEVVVAVALLTVACKEIAGLETVINEVRRPSSFPGGNCNAVTQNLYRRVTPRSSCWSGCSPGSPFGDSALVDDLLSSFADGLTIAEDADHLRLEPRSTARRSASCDRRVRGSPRDDVFFSDDPTSANGHIVEVSTHRGADGNELSRNTSTSSGRRRTWQPAVPRRKLASAVVIVVAASLVFSVCALVSSTMLAVGPMPLASSRKLPKSVANVAVNDYEWITVDAPDYKSKLSISVVNKDRKNFSRAKSFEKTVRHVVSRNAPKPVGKVQAQSTSSDNCGPVHLRRLDIKTDRKQITTLSERAPDALVPQSAWRRIVNTPGDRLDPLHMTVVPFVSAMQWKHNVFGTVAQFNGVGYGKLTSLLAKTVDGASGERLFVADTFASLPVVPGIGSSLNVGSPNGRHPNLSLTGMISNFDVFAAHVKDTSGFDEHAKDPSRRLFVYRGRLDDLRLNASAAGYLVDQLPQFRFVVVGNSSYSLSRTPSSSDGSLTALETAVCFLREGGLIVVDQDTKTAVVDGSSVDDGRHRSHQQQQQQLQRLGMSPLVEAFFARHGRSVITPLLSAGNKLYLTTTSFRRKYIEYIGEAGDWLALHIGKSPVRTTTASSFGGYDFMRL